MVLKEVVMDDLYILFGHLPTEPDEKNKKLEIHDIRVETEHSTLLISYYYYYYCYYCCYFCFYYNSTTLIFSCFIHSSSTAWHSTASSVSSSDVDF